MLLDLVDRMYVLCYLIWLTVCAMLHDLVDCMYVLCYMIWLTVCMCYVT